MALNNDDLMYLLIQLPLRKPNKVICDEIADFFSENRVFVFIAEYVTE